jgi:hypothetical protein
MLGLVLTFKYEYLMDIKKTTFQWSIVFMDQKGYEIKDKTKLLKRLY